MHAAGDPGHTGTPVAKGPAFGRTAKVEGWVVRPVDRDDDSKPRRYEPGLVLSVDGAFHRLDSELRGWGQRDFPKGTRAAPFQTPVCARPGKGCRCRNGSLNPWAGKGQTPFPPFGDGPFRTGNERPCVQDDASGLISAACKMRFSLRCVATHPALLTTSRNENIVCSN